MGLPFVVSVRTDCREWSCIRLYRGPITATALSDYAADELLDLPSIPSISLKSLASLKQKVLPLKVLAVAVSMSKAGSGSDKGRGSGGSSGGSLALRVTAGRQRGLMRFARTQLQVRVVL